MKGLLLDTHAWIWFAEGISRELPRPIIGAIDDAMSQGRLWVSVISVWEIALLQSKNRLRLRLPCRVWVGRALSASGLRLAGLEPAVAIDSNFLSGEPHTDPVDRILIATARYMDLRLVTRDREILSYGQQGFVHTLAI